MPLSEALGLLASTIGKIAVGKRWKYTPIILAVGSVIWAYFGLVEEHYGITVYHVIMMVYSLWSQKEWSKG